MEEYAWILWAVVGVGLIVAETFTFGFVLFWFGIGALAAAVAGLFGVGFLGQFLIFAIVSIALTVLSRTIFARFLSHADAEQHKSAIDSLPGQIGTVTGASRGALNSGEVKVYGSIWTAFPVEGEQPLAEGEKVEVVGVKGASLHVRRIRERELPEWREND